MLDRAAFDRALTEKARDVGADVMLGTRFTGLRKGRAMIDKESGEEAVIETGIEADVIIGADGPRSSVGAGIGVVNEHFLAASQCTVPLGEPLEHTHVFFDKEYYGGYGWLFPKGDVANVGVGIVHRPGSDEKASLRNLLGRFVGKLAAQMDVGTEPLSVTGGLIPAGGPVRTVTGNVLLVGDAAGQTHPLTGGGVPQAVVCGRLAGEAAAAAVKEGDVGPLSLYETEWKDIYLPELERGVRKRRLLESRWDELETVIRSCWVSFPEYYR
jgi:flavin-dependent dehydrogenase